MPRSRAPVVLLVTSVAATAMLGAALASGSAALSIAEVIDGLAAPASAAGEIIWRLRLPRALAAYACGGLLALSGALLQTLLRNPLAEPYLLGVSGGAAVGALLVMWCGLTSIGVPLGAAAGAAGVTALLMLMARRDFSGDLAGASGADSGRRMLLAGVALASLCGAAVALILSLAPEAQLRGMVFWLMGDLGGVQNGVEGWGIAMSMLVIALAILLPQAYALNLLTRGDAVAQTLGVNVRRLRLLAFMLAALTAAVAVATAGTIGFVGLVAPHLTRLVTGNDQRVLLPASVLGGGTLLLLADTLARTMAAPLQLPTGALMALIGAPVFMHLLFRRNQVWAPPKVGR